MDSDPVLEEHHLLDMATAAHIANGPEVSGRPAASCCSMFPVTFVPMTWPSSVPPGSGWGLVNTL